MDDSGTIAGIVPLATIPIYASPLLLQPVYRKLHGAVSQIYYRNNRCVVIQWQSLHPSAITQGAHCHASHPGFLARGTEERYNASEIKAVIEFLQNVWQMNPSLVARPVARPPYLDLAKDYLQIDADVLLAIVLLDGGSGAPE
ncbi:hypothetical protein G7Y89_g5226 [Cudoniella acicularis]|uniref:Uncharacterized protein n=1 Tax=Cudoniella acicularis TaxID=354080 RepID=A0A8H4RNN9_9HELO|nr:hypothetical protein G7Y89_g5226 [Cudoniella acicularis]